MRFDFHTHTSFSFDANQDAAPRRMCEAALQKGLSGIALTDHFDVNGAVEGIYDPFDADASFLAATEVKEEYRGRLRVSCGIELGQATEYPAEARAFLEKHPYDFVLASIHNLPSVPDFHYLKYDEMPEALYNSLFQRTLEEAERLCDFEGIHAIAHLTYMHRYLAKAGRSIDFRRFRDQLDSLFRKMIRKDLALEINVSLLRSGIDLFMPAKELILQYKNLGGSLITVGSDAHTPDAVGLHIEDAYAFLREIGIHAVAFYERGIPDLIPI